jgi:L-aminopeptidase/D-esterase-like protein
MDEIHALLLTGGSAFGLGAADGVMRWLKEQDRGYHTPWVKVPIVPAAVVFDLNLGSNSVWPDAHAGYQACQNAAPTGIQEGNVGAGTGATVGKWKGMEFRMKGGIGISHRKLDDLVVVGLAVVNAVGDVIDEQGNILAGARDANGKFFGQEDPHRQFARGKVLENANTTLVAVVTNADLSKVELHRVAQRMHDGMARAVVPSHTSYDGDATFALSHGELKVDFDLVAEVSAAVTADSIRRAVRAAHSVNGVPGLAG